MTGVRLTRRQAGALAVLAACAVVPPLLGRAAPGVLTAFRSQTLAVGASLAAMAISLNLLMGYAGQISLGHGALLGVGAYSAGIIAGRYYLPAGLGFLVAAALGGLVAFLVGLPALRLRGLYLAITTLAFTVLMENSVFQIPWLSRGSAGVEIPRPYAWSWNLTRNSDYLALVLVALVLMWLLDANVVRTKLGRAFHGIREDEQVAQSFGVDTARYKLLAFTLSGALAGIAGALYGHLVLFVNSETFRFDRFSLLLVVLVVIGGLGNRAGVAAAAAVYAVLPRLLTAIRGWDLVIGAALLIVAVVRHPGGFPEAIAEARGRRAARAARVGTDTEPDDTAVPPLPHMPRPADRSGGPVLRGDRPMLEVHDLVVRFGGLAAVDGMSLAVAPNAVVGLIGPNGAGKSTLFNAVSGFVTPDAGRIELMGQRIDDLPPHARAGLGMGRTFQHLGLARNLSVRDNLLLAQHQLARYPVLGALGYTGAVGAVERDLRERAEDAVGVLGLERHLDTPVKHLSGGQQRIVEMACALVSAPELLLLDEPSAGMSPAAVESLAERLRDLRDSQGRTILLVEHHIPLVLDVCDEVYVMAAGRLLAHGEPAEVTRDPAVVEAYLGSTPGDAPAAPRTRAATPKRNGTTARSRRKVPTP